MRFPFRDLKTVQAAAYLLKRAGGELNYMTLIKLLYLADREMLLARGLPITGDRAVSMKYGPVLSRVLEFINEGGEPNNPSAWFEYISPPKDYAVSLKKEAATDELSKYELGILDKTFDKFGHVDKWDLVHLLHEILPEWQDPGESSRPIEPEDILRAESRSEEEIRETQAAAEEMRFLMGSNSP
jgi:uncharacterized phage-associated protein